MARGYSTAIRAALDPETLVRRHRVPRSALAVYTVGMTLKTTSIVQTFVLKRKRLTPGDREVAPTESGALMKAAAAAMAARLPGAAAIKVIADDETGELESATILGAFGEVPDDFAETLQGG